jgi:hypothetical protein
MVVQQSADMLLIKLCRISFEAGEQDKLKSILLFSLINEE